MLWMLFFTTCHGQHMVLNNDVTPRQEEHVAELAKAHILVI